MKKVIIIHGWGGDPQGNWFPWIKKELESKGIKVEIPAMPNTDAPDIEHWVGQLAKSVNPNDENYLIGHSMGVQAVLRYVEKLPENVKVGGILLVSGFITSLSDVIMANPEDAVIAKPWLETPIDLEKVRAKVPKIISMVSDNDPYIPEDNWKKFEMLGDLIILHDRGHIQGEEPELLKIILEILG